MREKWRLEGKGFASTRSLWSGVNAAVIGVCLLMVASLWIVLMVRARSDGEETIKHAVQRNDNLVAAFEHYAVRTIESADALLRVVRREYARSGAGIDLGALMAELEVDVAPYQGMGIIDEHGDLVTTTMKPQPATANFGDREHFRVHVARDTGSVFVGKPVVSRILGESSIPITLRIDKPDGSFGGVVVAQIQPRRFTSFYQDARLGLRDIVTLVGNDGSIRARRIGDRETSGEDIHTSPVFGEIGKGPVGHFAATGTLDGVRRLFSFRKLRNYPLIVMAGEAEADVLAAFVERKSNSYFAAAAVTGFIVLIASLLVVTLRRKELVLERLAIEKERLRATFDQAAMGIARTGLDGRFLYVNQKLSDLLGYAPRELLARKVVDVTHPDDLAVTTNYVAELLEDTTGKCVPERDMRYVRKDGTPVWATISATAVRDRAGNVEHIVTMIQDITTRKEGEERLRRVAKARRVTAECRRVLMHAVDEGALLHDMCRALVGPGGYKLAWVGVAESDEEKSIRPIAHAGVGGAYLSAVRLSWGDREGGQGSSGRAIRAGRPCVIGDIEADPALACWHDAVRTHGFKSVASLPLFRDGMPSGVLTIHAADRDAFDAEQISLLEELAADIDYGILTLVARADHVRSEASLRLRADLLAAVGQSVIATDINGAIIYVNPFAEKLYGWTSAAMVGGSIIDVTPVENSPLQLAEIAARLPMGEPWSGEVEVRRHDGTLLPVQLSISPIRDGSGALVGTIGISSDITERKASERQIEYLATHDALTDLPNRNLLNDRLTQAIAHARRMDSTLGLIFLDLDHFKYINDAYGHPVGDALLKAVADTLRGLLRSGDTVARLGGDEFVILLTDLEDPLPNISTVARKLLDTFARPFLIETRELALTASMGISLYPADGDDLDELLKNADAAMYRAKEMGRNEYQFYASEMSIKAVERVTLEIALRQALSLGQFELHYQPLVLIATGEAIGMEALIRWRHPQLGLVAPDRFIPLAEETGLIVPIGEWVLRTACAQNRLWRDSGMPPLTVAVNLSALQLRQPGFVELVEQVLADTGLDPRVLNLELTESMVMGKTDAVVGCLSRLRSLGVTLSMDDFGTGYSNLGHLAHLPLDIVKIDRSFVRDVPGHPGASAIARTIVSMGRGLGMRVVAEGVETLEQAQFLQSIWCEQAQGFLYSKPLPAAQFAAWIGSHAKRKTASKLTQTTTLEIVA